TLGDKNYAQGSVYNLNKSLRNLIDYVTSDAPYTKEITAALGSGLGFLSPQNRTLRNLGTNPESAASVEAECISALTLISTAYDGNSRHKQPEEMPQDLYERLFILQNQLVCLQSSMLAIPQYYPDTLDSTNN